MAIDKMEAIEWAYIAGFFDGEGSLNMKRGYLGKNALVSYIVPIRLFITQGGADGLSVLQSICGFLIRNGIRAIIGKGSMRSPLSHRLVYDLQVTDYSSLTKILSGLLPYLRLKKTAIQDSLRFMKLYPPRRKGNRWSPALPSLEGG